MCYTRKCDPEKQMQKKKHSVLKAAKIKQLLKSQRNFFFKFLKPV